MELRKKGVWGVVVAVVLCAVIACFFALIFRVSEEAQPKEQIQPQEDESSARTESSTPPPAGELSRTDQGIAAIKAEELRLAETLIEDFRNDEDPLIIMGDVKYMHGDANEAMEYFGKALKINPMRPDVHIKMSDIFAKKGKFAESILHLQKVAAIQPKTPNTHGRIGELYVKLNDLDKAIQSFEKELKIAPNVNAYFLIGQSYVIKNETEKAKENYEAAIKIDPNLAKAHYGLGTVYAKLGQRDKAKNHLEICRKLKAEARKDLKAARTMYDDMIQTRKNSAISYIKAGKIYRSYRKMERAEELLNRAAQLDPENVGGLLELASLYQRTDRTSEVREMHVKISQLEFEHADNCIIFGNLSVELQLLDEAERAYRKATTLAPNGSVGYRKLAQLYLQTEKELPEARRLAQKAVDLEPVAVNYSVLSAACLVNADAAAAIQAIKKALELDPRNREYQRRYDLIRRMSSR